MIEAVRTLAGLSLAIISAISLAVPASAQTVYVPAPEKLSPRPAWNCRAQQSVGATSIRASRQLDAAGAPLTDGAGWTDIFTADAQAPLTVSLNWHPHPSPMRFEDGVAAFFFRAGQPMAGPLSLKLGSKRTGIPAGQAYDNPSEFSAYAPVGTLLSAAGGDAALPWELRGKAPGKGGARISKQGFYPADELRALQSGFAKLLAQLDGMQADFARRCIRQ